MITTRVPFAFPVCPLLCATEGLPVGCPALTHRRPLGAIWQGLIEPMPAVVHGPLRLRRP